MRLMHLQASLLAKWITLHCPFVCAGLMESCAALANPTTNNGVTTAQGKQLSAEFTSLWHTRRLQNGAVSALYMAVI